jgi:hypothetical protein
VVSRAAGDPLFVTLRGSRIKDLDVARSRRIKGEVGAREAAICLLFVIEDQNARVDSRSSRAVCSLSAPCVPLIENRKLRGIAHK